MSEQDYPPLPEAAAIHGFHRVYISDQMRAYAAADRAQQSARHAEELAAYALTVANLRTRNEELIAACVASELRAQPDDLIGDCVASISAAPAPQAQPEQWIEEQPDGSFIEYEPEEMAQPAPEPERKPTTDDQCIALFNLVQRGMGFRDQDVVPFTSGVAAGEHFHGIKEKP